MLELVQELIPNIPRFSAVVALFPVSFKVFAWVEDRAFDQRKRRDFGVAEINRKICFESDLIV
jgi:hypothetical protein